MQNKQCLALCLVALVLGQTFALPPHIVLPEQIGGGRKFMEKQNALKKVAANDDLDDVGTNSLQESVESGFSWSSMLQMLVQMLTGQAPNFQSPSPSKAEIEEPAQPVSTWGSLFSVGLRILTALFNGVQQQFDGLDKSDNPANNPMQFVGIVINLLEALKTSFSHRSLHARSLGRKDHVSEAAVASISMIKGYLRSMKSFSNVGRAEEEGQRGCAERALCEANAECAADTQGASGVFCQLGSYATSYILQRQSGIDFKALYEAGKRGRSGEDCRTLFLDCNAV